ncbi:MAG TPA: thiamine pyrophosphate-binding protein, partial [Burkholderiales bacterium]|nr:thiamine pyrophosphate-binding protein [Burkholderiales bacterium]
MDEPTIPIRPLADTKPAAKPEPAPKAEAPQPKSQPAPAPAPKPQPAAPKVDPRIEPWLEPPAPKTDPGAFKPETAADAWLGLLAARGIEYLFANGGTDFAPVVEAYAKGQKLGWKLPQIVIVPHENMGVAMAHGYTMITGRPQAMMVHVGVGT